MNNGPIFLVDASAFIHRAFHAIRNLATHDGRPTGAIYGFIGTLLKLLKDKKPEALAVVFDSSVHGRRYEIYPNYKANRGPMDEDLKTQQKSIRQIVASLGLYALEKPGFEADDLIASATRKFVDIGLEVVIVSSDKDFYQLLSELVSMYDPDPRKNSALTLKEFRQRFGLEPRAFLDIQALMGDSSDNIPGVPKVGEKTALKLIAQYGSLDNLYSRLSEVTPNKLRETLSAHRASAYLSHQLASLGQDITLDLTLEDLKPTQPDRARLTTLFTNLEFTRLLNDPILESVNLLGHGDLLRQSPVTYERYVLVNNPEAWGKLDRALAKTKILSINLETDNPNPNRARLMGLSLCVEPELSFYIPINHQTLDAGNQSWEIISGKIGPYLSDPNLPKIAQNAKFNWLILARHGLFLPAPIDDPMLASYLLDPESRHGLGYLSRNLLGHTPISFKEVVPNSKKNFSDLTPEAALNYAAENADVALRLSGILRNRLKDIPTLSTLYEEVELPLEALLVRMEIAGVLINAEALGRLSHELGGQLKIIEEKIFNLTGHPFNIASPKQLAEVLFKEQGLTPLKKTAKKTNFSTNDTILAELALLHPLPKEIREWRGLDKLKSTYTDKLPREINPKTGRIHTSYNQTQTATGRLSSSEPNLQNIPLRDGEGRRIREAFIASPGFSLVAADYSQIELRILAHFSQDEALLRSFERDEDIHTQTAAEIFGLDSAEVTPALRREAKTINFGIVYGQGAFALSKQLGIHQAKARDFINRYFARFPGVKRYMEETCKQARSTGQITTWFGRPRFLKGITGSYQSQQEAERIAINTPIQGTAADIIKMAMLAVDRRLRCEYPEARLIMQVHDELVLEVPTSQIPAISELLKTEMAGVAATPPISHARALTTPLKVDVGAGPTWAAAH
ncbi:MAG: DNA polymerase I [Candidatus Adiutrix intracellularis]|jgi:DNA polymerase-1|nr:DNA polymerase I [Candidatus Adiutrix intracellularis]